MMNVAENDESRRPEVDGFREFGESDDSDVLGFVALAALADVELDVVTFVERLVALAGDVGVVDEDVFSTLTGDEAEALLVVEEFHGALHWFHFRIEHADMTCSE